MKNGGLRKKIITGFFIFEVLLAVFISALVGYRYYKHKMEEYESTVYKYLESASHFIDGDKILGYLETGKTDEYYDEILSYLDSTRYGTEIITFCVFVPYEDDLRYIWMSSEGESSYEWLGKTEGYMENGKETRDETFRRDPVQKVSKYEYDGNTILAGFYPVFDSKGDPVALIDVDLSFPSTVRSILLFVITIVSGIILISLIMGVVLYKYFDRILIKPIGTLNQEARKMVERLDDEEADMTGIDTGDELEELYDSFRQMNVDVRHYIKENVAIVAERERMGADLALASRIQSGMLPDEDHDLKSVGGFSLYANMTPAKEVGGDFYDYFMIDEKHLAFLIADVSDKGIGAALFMAISKSLIKARAGMGGSAAEILKYVDRMISEKNSEGMFVTVWFAIVDLTTGKVDVCNAGHDYPAVMKNGGEYVIEKTVHGVPLAFIPNSSFLSYEMELVPGDRIFLYTDGVNEAKNSDGKRFEYDRLLSVLNDNRDIEDRELVETVKKAVQDFEGEEPQFDDMTMLSFTFEGRKKG